MMTRIPARHRSSLTLALATASALLMACGGDTLAPELQHSSPTLLVGQVRAPSAAGGSIGGNAGLSGIEVSAAGSGVTTTTNVDGAFQLEVRAEDGRVRLRFRRGALDVELEIDGVQPGGTLQVTVSLSESGARLDDDGSNDDNGNDAGGETEFEGTLVALSTSGVAPARVARVVLNGGDTSWSVDIVEGETTFDGEGDLLSFDALLAGHAAGSSIKIEGDGTPQADGTLRAVTVKVEVDDDDDGSNDDNGNDADGETEFEGTLVALSTSGVAPARVARVVLNGGDTSWSVDIVEGETTFDGEGDLLSFDALLAGHAAGSPIKIEGDGTPQADGTLRAATVKVEVDD